jgi:hypothetical protein
MRIPMAVCLVFIAGCSSISVRTDYDRAFDFSSYETFGWLPKSEMPAGDPAVRSGFVGKRIVGSVEAELEAKGYRRDARPDFLLSWFVVVRERTQVVERGHSYGRRRYGGYREIDVRTQQVGSLVLDVIDAGQKELVWRGTASAVVGDPEGSEERIREAVGKLLAGFPPGRVTDEP